MSKILSSKILGNGKPLIILHGLFGMHQNWLFFGKEISKHFQTHLVDLRNHGDSFHHKDHNYNLMSKDIYNYLNFHSIKKVNIIGHSMGGKVAMFFATNYSEFVNKLVIVDISPKYYHSQHENIVNALIDLKKINITSRIQADERLKKFNIETNIRQFLLKNLIRYNEQFKLKLNINSISKNIKYISSNLPNDQKFYKQTLFLKGANSDYIKKNDLELIKFHFPNSNIIEVNNSSHWIHFENPSEFYFLVHSFLINK